MARVVVGDLRLGAFALELVALSAARRRIEQLEVVLTVATFLAMCGRSEVLNYSWGRWGRRDDRESTLHAPRVAYLTRHFSP